MTQFIYAPILKFKEGEIKGYGNLTPFEKERIFPIFDLVDNVSKEKILDKLVKNNIKNIGLDVFKVFGQTNYLFLNELIQLLIIENSINLVPIVNVKDNDFKSIIAYLNSNLIGIRIPLPLEYNSPFRIPNIFEFLEDLNKNFFLILDLEDVKEENLNVKFFLLEDAINNYRNYFKNKKPNVVFSSNSFPEDINDIEKGNCEFFFKKELEIYNLIKSKYFDINFIYSDYGVTKYVENNLDFQKIDSSKILAKIRYTLEDYYLIYRGKNADITNSKIGYRTLSNMLINSGYYKGENFSFGDKKIMEISKGNKEDGGKGTTWVTISTNHHLTLVLKQLVQ